MLELEHTEILPNRAQPTRLIDEPERRVIRQLVEALLFEGLVEYSATPLCSIPGAKPYEPIYDTYVVFLAGSAQYCCVAAIKAFSRVRVASGSVKRVVGCDLEDPCLVELVSSLPIARDPKQRLLGELQQTLELSRWNLQQLPHQHTPRRNLSFQRLESAIVEGHLYHPSFKSRTGFSLQDHRDYGSEAGNQFQLRWLAVARARVRTALPCDEAVFWRQELGPEVYSFLTAQLQARGGSWTEHALVPIHPWQLSSIAELGVHGAIERGEIILLGEAGDFYQASQSLRTLINASRPERANVKLPLNVVCTSTHRNLRPHFVCTAPMLSEWLVLLVEQDPFLQANERLLLLREYAGILYQSEATASDGKVDDAQALLGAIYRESVNSKLTGAESAVPFTALMLVESDDRPFIADWLDTYGTERWVLQLIEVMLIPIWHLLVHHGIAFESHAQNLILVHVQGWPRKIVLRDFHEDTEYVPAYLSRPELVPDFAGVEPYFAVIPDDDGYRMASTDALRELFMDTVYVYNLTELSFLLERRCGFGESRFWSLVRERLRAYAQSGVTDQSRISQLESDSAEIVVESLLMKKFMNGDVLDFYEHTIRNTLRS